MPGIYNRDRVRTKKHQGGGDRPIPECAKLRGGIRVRHLNPGIISPTCRIVIIGKTHTGKSVLVKDFMYHLQQSFEFILGFIGTADTRKDYAKSFGPVVTLHPDYDTDTLKETLAIEEILLDLGSSMHPGVVIVDDCSKKNSSVFKDDALVELAKNARHYNLGCIIATQYCMDLTPAWRNQVDILVLLRNGIPQERKKIFNVFFGGDYHEFERLMDACTNDYRALVLDNRSPETDIQKRIYWYKAQQNLPKFDVRSPVFKHLELKYALPPEVVVRNRLEELMNRAGVNKKKPAQKGRKKNEDNDNNVVIRLPPTSKPKQQQSRKRSHTVKVR